MANIKIYIPTFVSDQNFTPARVNPRAFFYNGTLDCEPFLIEANEGGVISQTPIPAFPYFDHYSLEPGGTEPGPSSNSLLFLNENAVYGTPPTSSLYDSYWEKYVSLLYDPATRLLDASAIIALADYNEMELNDIVQFRGNYFHLRAINEYDVKTGVCKIQLLGPILNDALDIPAPIICDFDFTAVNYTPTPTTTTTTSTTAIGPTTTTTTSTTLCPFDEDTCLTYRFVGNQSFNNYVFRYVECGTRNIISDTVAPGETKEVCGVSGSVKSNAFLTQTDLCNGFTVARTNTDVAVSVIGSCSAVPSFLLGVSQEGSAAACDDFAFADTYWGNASTFVLSTQIWSDSMQTTLAPAGFYSDGTNWKYWNGSSFTGSGIC